MGNREIIATMNFELHAENTFTETSLSITPLTISGSSVDFGEMMKQKYIVSNTLILKYAIITSFGCENM